MFGSAPAPRLTGTADGANRAPFLDSHRALGACTRELARLTDEILGGVDAMRNEGIDVTPDVRRSPERCILQLGPVALTMAWLRSALDTAASGELLLIGWQGSVAPRAPLRPERSVSIRTGETARALWEDVLVAVASTEEDWRWRPKNGRSTGLTSQELAARSVQRLRQAFVASRDDR